MLRKRIKERIKEHFKPEYLEVHNDSHRHCSTSSLESHFLVTVVSDKFLGQALSSRHRSVYKVLREELQEGLYALALRTYTSGEWKAAGQADLPLPLCHRTKNSRVTL